jgi:hypothetical protein
MADNLDFGNARAATYQMLPGHDEEVTALWARKAVGMAGRAIGAWGTVILEETSTSGLGTGYINFASNEFNEIPDIEFWSLRGGTELAKPGMIYNSVQIGFYARIYGGTQVYIQYLPDEYAGNSVSFTGNRAQFGTFIYRMSGW